jgi:hypothetical protein
MLITGEKIQVTQAMMDKANMTRMTPGGLQVGVPYKDSRDNWSLSWKTLMVDTTEEDYDAIEEYFLEKSQQKEGT